MKHYLPILLIVCAFVTQGCNLLFRLPVGGPQTTSTETFTVDEAVPSSAALTSAALAMAPSNASLLLSGNADRLAGGEIQYNVTDWKPTVTVDGDTLRIEQKLPENSISSTPKGAINDWDLTLGPSLKDITISCSAGNYTLTFADTLPDGANIKINAGVGNMRLVFPAGVTANVEVHRGPVNITTEGEWVKTGKVYTSGQSEATWTVKVDIGVGNLTLASQ